VNGTHAFKHSFHNQDTRFLSGLLLRSSPYHLEMVFVHVLREDLLAVGSDSIFVLRFNMVGIRGPDCICLPRYFDDALLLLPLQ
jgi:hypothetical protein